MMHFIIQLSSSYSHAEEEEEHVFKREYMVWETSLETKYGRWHEGHPFDSSVITTREVYIRVKM